MTRALLSHGDTESRRRPEAKLGVSVAPCLRGWQVLGVLLLGLPALAHEHAPRILSPHNADAYSMKTFADFPRWRDLKGDAKVYEIYAYLADRRTGIFPLGVPAWEGRETLSEYGAVRDPVKMLNVYPIGHCGTLGPTMAGVMEGMGIGPARTLVLPGLHHVVAEVFYDGKWHYLDLDLRAVFRRPDGTLASLEEAKTDATLWKGPNAPLFFPLDPLDEYRKLYAKTAVHLRHGLHTGGHTMDYVLRQGETFTRWWKPQAGRWNHHPSYHQRPFPRNILEQKPRGPKGKHAGFSVHTHGNGRFTYRPDLTDRSTDLEDGIYDAPGLRPGPSGLTGSGFAIFEVRSPYVIVPLVGDLEDPADDREASVVRLDAEGASLSVSVDHGLTWKETGPDLTPQVSGRYGYLVKVSLKEGGVVRSLEITTWVQLHPASLPSLRKGRNEMRYVTGDHHGLESHVVEIRTEGEEFLKYLAEPPADFDAGRATCRAKGPFVARLPAPPGKKVAWFSAGGSFVAHQGEAAPRTRNSMAYGVEKGGPFQEFYRAEIPAGQSHWHTNADVEVKLEAPAREVLVKYVGEPGVNNLRLYAHCVDDAPAASGPVSITHAWREGGELRKKTVTLEKPGPYEVVVEGEPVDEYIELSVPSRPR